MKSKTSYCSILTLLLHVRKVTGSNFMLETGYYEVFFTFLSPSRQLLRQYLKIGHDLLFPKFITRYHAAVLVIRRRLGIVTYKQQTGKGPVARSCEHGNKTPASMKGGKFIG